MGGRILLILMCLMLNVSVGEALITSPAPTVTQHFEKISLPTEVEQKVLNIAVYEEAPFAFREKGSDSYQGISIDVWEFIARKNGLSFKYIPVTKEEGIQGVSQGTYDLFLGGVPNFVQEKRLQFDYTGPFYVSGIGIASLKSDPFKIIIDYFISWNFFKIALFLFAFILVQAGTTLFFERKKKPSYKKSFWESLGNALWWSGSISALNGIGDVNTGTLWGRITAIFWMFFALMLVNIFTGSIVSKLTVGELTSHVEGLNDLRQLNILCLERTPSKQFLEDHFISCRVIGSLEEGFQSLSQKKAQALIYAESVLKYEMKRHSTSALKFTPAGAVNEYYSFMVPRGSAILYFLNQEILDLVNMQKIRTILVKYFGDMNGMRN